MTKLIRWTLGNFFVFVLRSVATETLFLETFESGGTNFTLNTSDLGGTAAPNFFIVNNDYAGGSGSLTCFGFPFSYTVSGTATQPAGITNAPNSYYLHILNSEAQADGILCSTYLAADDICFFSDSMFARMNNDVSTLGLTNVALTFWWACGGSSDAYGEIYYSTNAGNDWTQITSPISSYFGQTTWTQQTIQLPAFDEQPQLRFAFRMVNNTAASASDPGFSIDDVTIIGDAKPPVANQITRVEEGLETEWQTVPGFTYQLLHTSLLLPSAWSNLGNATVATDILTSILITNLDAQGFHSLEQLPD